MKNPEILSILRLQATKNVGDIISKKLISVVGSVEGIFKEKATTLHKINGIGTNVTSELFKEKYLHLAEEEFAKIEKHNIEYSYFLDANYPKNLQQCIDSPILIFKDGNINLNNERIISIIGTRKITNYGRGFIKEFVQDLKKFNPIIVSGLAYGCDIEAHKMALENDLQTIAILAHGFDRTYPSAHKKYVNKINENGGFLTEFWHNTTPIRENFLKRNRIVAGISQATIVIESASKGGSLVTANIANSYNREVFALSGRNTDVYSKGCNNLIKSYESNLLTSAEDVVKMLNWDIETPKKSIAKQVELFLNLDETEQKIYDYLQQNGKQLLDVIAKDCQIPVYKLSSILTTMELQGAVKKLPGKLFEI